MNSRFSYFRNAAYHFRPVTLFLFALILSVIVSSFIKPVKHTYAHKEYVVKSLPGAGFKLDGKLDEKQWLSCNAIKNFMSPWVPGAKDHTVFRSFHDDQYFYFSYIVQDSTMTVNKYINEETVLGEDRVEMFLSQTADLKQYFGFEMDPQAKMTDYEAGSDHHFNFDWNTQELVTKTQQHKYGYELEGRVTLSFIRNIAIKDSKTLSVYAGVFRGDFFGNNMNAVTWFSWLRPASDTPNFHIPSSFGIFRFENAVQ